ncbi:hypothetical protein D3C85_961600 [compost metagenome]
MVPRAKLKPMLRAGFLISPAIKVTLCQESLLNIEPTIAAAMAPKAASVVYDETDPLLGKAPSCHIFSQLLFQIPLSKKNNPNIIKPNKLKSLATVNVVWITLPPLTPRLLM